MATWKKRPPLPGARAIQLVLCRAVSALSKACYCGATARRHAEAVMFPAQQLDVVVTAEDSMLPVGTVASVVGNMIVVQV